VTLGGAAALFGAIGVLTSPGTSHGTVVDMAADWKVIYPDEK
jgi:hypothetical protein